MTYEILFYSFFVLLLLNIASIIWSGMGIFAKCQDKRARDVSTLMNISLLNFVVAIYSTSQISHQYLWVLIAGLVLQVVSFVLFWYSSLSIRKEVFTIAFSNDQPSHLFTKGPYRMIRNPFYTSYMLCYLSVIIFSLSVINIPFVVAIFLVYLRACRHEENKFINSDLKDEYENYFNSTGRFFPKFS